MRRDVPDGEQTTMDTDDEPVGRLLTRRQALAVGGTAADDSFSAGGGGPGEPPNESEPPSGSEPPSDFSPPAATNDTTTE
ncbi:hypothetical protein HBNXHx_2167 [Haloferax volcanii]|nr:hypothetical protein HBNXHx_2167 [Haloferax alexandrinus]